MKNYQQEFDASVNDREVFWKEKAANIDWYKFPEKIVSKDPKDFWRWYEGGSLNTAYLCLDYHVANGRAEQTALIYDSPVTKTQKKFTYRELQTQVAKFAGALRDLGVEKGDTVIIYMPMVPEAIVGMLACARLGAIHSVVFGGFAPHELALRIDDARPKVILSASCGIEFDKVIPYKPLLDRAIDEAFFKPKAAVILQRPMLAADLKEGHDYDWKEVAEKALPADCVPVEAWDPLYILYTSGTTGKPKGILRDNGGHAVAMKYSMEAVYNVKPGETFWAASDIGWAVGHSYIVYAPLIHGCTTIVFEGKPVRTPDPGTFWRVIAEHKVSVFFTAPTAIRAIKKEDSEGEFIKKYDLSNFRTLFLAGERCDVATLEWAKQHLNIPVIDHWWQTESGSPMLANMLGVEALPVKAGSPGKPVSGYDVRIMDEDGTELPAGKEGFVVIQMPLGPGAFPFLWHDDERFKESYLNTFRGYYLTGDGGYKDEDGYFYITGRIDDVINVAGHRLSTAEMEEILAGHLSVAECAVVGIADGLRGQRPVGLVVIKDNHPIEPEVLEAELVEKVREQIGAVAFFRNAIVVKRLPKTRSGKILRKIIRKIADSEPFAVPSTIDDPAILDEIKESFELRRIGVAFEVQS
ncbi:propionyl-CoA synthetase [Flexibacter flexilis DSM 6793]|uniref:Propionyl-CoA synthetase n=1 Tax=Flexibacter flexilis DSM 6793 TaxID=927664 RepID=A0A1I1HTX5_9BACT|nr:propionyl-CoA synthetase [Flexibacter flexilis]SFC27517.1 propionyl-CoA synthetase [Flexibacter flexilis DSM 6793]